MTWADWGIVIVLAGSVAAGAAQGFFRTACSLIGLIGGLSLAAWNYARIAAVLLPLVRVPAIADTIGFFLIALVVMAIANVIGTLLGKAFDWLGLGCLNMLGGAAIGFLQGVVLVTLGILVAAAFFPQAELLRNSHLAGRFEAACRAAIQLSPEELADKVRHGLGLLKQHSPHWPNSGSGA
jgi:membrane protein required for colicin V production